MTIRKKSLILTREIDTKAQGLASGRANSKGTDRMKQEMLEKIFMKTRKAATWSEPI